jgi:pyruvate/2-oxoglutarate dehydrogenase complex dihydrolipoamide dehydrogenase (E3) component
MSARFHWATLPIHTKLALRSQSKGRIVAKKSLPRDRADLDPADLDELSAFARKAFEVRDRTYGFPPKRYPKCFVGSEAVKRIMEAGIASDADDAVRIGNLLLEAGVFRHVLNEHPFRNGNFFYRFTADADRGGAGTHDDGSAVSWADFLTPFTDGAEEPGLQPRVPEHDPRFGAYAQDDLDAVGVAPLDAHNVTLLDNVHPRTWRDPKPKPRYNLVVIGAGAGGLVSSAAAAGLGAEVALVESHLLGGDCLNVGCVPSKALLHSAKVAASARGAAAHGVKVGSVEVDFPAVMARMRRLRAGIAPHDSARRYADELGVDVFFGRARFTGRHSVEVNGKTLHFAKAVIATGATAAIPDIPGLADVPYLTNATLFNLTQLPPRLAVIGAGPIGMELAQAFQRFGSQVIVLYRGRLLAKEDPEAAAIVEASMRSDGVRFQHCEFHRVARGDRGAPIRITVAIGDRVQTLKFDAVLVAAGRKPAVRDMGLEAAGVEFDPRTGVKVNDRLQTTNPDVFAVGDVASQYQFTHMSDFMARLVIRNALFLGRERVSRLLVPWATFTDPEVAHVGLYEADLEERRIPYTTITRHFADVDRARLDEETDGFVKIHVRKGGDAILGATIVGPHAGDLVSEISVAMQSGMGLGRLANVIHPYPTMAEAIRQCGDAYNRTRMTPTVRKIFNRLMAVQR